MSHENNIGAGIAHALLDVWKMMLDNSTPEQRKSWAKDIATTAFKGTAAHPDLFLGTHQKNLPLKDNGTANTPIELAMDSPAGFNQVVEIIYATREALLDKQAPDKKLKGFVL